jgi:hypothetical protein
MDTKYTEARWLIESVKSNLERTLKDASTKTLEDRKAYNIIDNLIQELDSTIWTIKHYSKRTIEGHIYENSRGRFELKDNEFTCGCPIEIYDEEEKEWYTGRVEHTTEKGYYFYCSDMGNPSLNEGMRVRIRVNND